MNKYSEIRNPKPEIFVREIMTPREAAEYFERPCSDHLPPGEKRGDSWAKGRRKLEIQKGRIG